MVKNDARTLIVALGLIVVAGTCEAQPAWTVGATAGWSSMVGETGSTFSPPLKGTTIRGFQSPGIVWSIREDVSSIVFAEAAGADCALSFHSQTALVFSGRYTFMNDDDRDHARGTPSAGLRMGGGIQWAF
jgi:hypothetical protein